MRIAVIIATLAGLFGLVTAVQASDSRHSADRESYHADASHDSHERQRHAASERDGTHKRDHEARERTHELAEKYHDHHDDHDRR